MNSLARKVIKYGFVSFVFLILTCLVLTILNKYAWGNSYTLASDTVDIFKASFSVLAIMVIGGLIADYISKNG